MAVKTIDEILESFKTRLGENPDDDSIAFLEDVTDTLDDFEKRANGDGTDWKSKYEENDANWRKKYRDRFSQMNQNQNQNQNQIIPRGRFQIYLRRFKRWLEELLTVR